MGVEALLESAQRTGTFRRVVNNPLAQFGPRGVLIGASLLPERNVFQNAYKETRIRYRSFVANNGSRYSPVQKKKGAFVGTFDVILAESDHGDDFTAREYDALREMLRNFTGAGNPPMEAVASLTDWIDRSIVQPLQIRNEVMRWQAIVDAEVVLTGDDGFYELVVMSKPTGHRVNAAAQWSNDANDPYVDIMNMADFLRGKGYEIRRILTSTPVVNILANNDKMRTRVGRFNISNDVVTGVPMRADITRLNQLMSNDNLPPFEVYDRTYRTQVGSGYYLKRDVVVFVCSTDDDFEVLTPDQIVPLENILGYTGVGTPAGEAGPGRAFHTAAFGDKPPRIEAQAWQTTLPVVLEPEAIGVIKSIT
jgi:hypothetical protein